MSSFFDLKQLGEVKGGVRIILEKVLGALERTLCLVELLLRHLRDAEGKPVITRPALGDDLRKDLLGARETTVLEEFLVHRYDHG